MISAQIEHIVLVDLIQAEYAHAHSTNRMHSLCAMIIIVFVIPAGGLVL